jgi:hypothetical protein
MCGGTSGRGRVHVNMTEVHYTYIHMCVYIYIYVYIYIHSNIMKPTKNCSKGGGRRRLRKRNIYWVNLIKVHYKHIGKYNNKIPLCD